MICLACYSFVDSFLILKIQIYQTFIIALKLICFNEFIYIQQQCIIHNFKQSTLNSSLTFNFIQNNIVCVITSFTWLENIRKILQILLILKLYKSSLPLKHITSPKINIRSFPLQEMTNIEKSTFLIVWSYLVKKIITFLRELLCHFKQIFLGCLSGSNQHRKSFSTHLPGKYPDFSGLNEIRKLLNYIIEVFWGIEVIILFGK